MSRELSLSKKPLNYVIGRVPEEDNRIIAYYDGGALHCNSLKEANLLLEYVRQHAPESVWNIYGLVKIDL